MVGVFDSLAQPHPAPGSQLRSSSFPFHQSQLALSLSFSEATNKPQTGCKKNEVTAAFKHPLIAPLTLPLPHPCMHHPTLLFFSVLVLCTCPQGSARSGWKLFRQPRSPPFAVPRSAPTASRTTPLQTSKACWSSVVTKAECWCPWRGAKSDSAKQNRYFQHRRDFLSIG